MAVELYAVAAGEVAGALKEIFSKFSSPEMRKKYKIEEAFEELLKREKRFHDAAVSFRPGSVSNELMGLAEAVAEQKKKTDYLVVIYAKELMK